LHKDNSRVQCRQRDIFADDANSCPKRELSAALARKRPGVAQYDRRAGRQIAQRGDYPGAALR